MKAKDIYEQIFGKTSFPYTKCLFEIGKIKFIQKIMQEAFVIFKLCLTNFERIFKNEHSKNSKYIQKTKLLLKTIERVTNGEVNKLSDDQVKEANK